MPSQSWDVSWSCDGCGMAGFRSLEDAELHEREECQHSNSPKRQRPGSPNAAAGEASFEAPFETRRIPLLGRDEQHKLDMADAVACQNLELFEATQEHMGERDASGSPQVVPGQIGIRCMHCVRTPLSAVDNRMIFPSSVFAVGSVVRAVAERHMLRCPLVPRHTKETIERSLAERKRGQDEDEERSREALLDHCTTVCQQAGVVERYPQDSGLIFRDADQQRQASFENPVSFAEGLTGPSVSPIGDLSFADDPTTRGIQHPDRLQEDSAPAAALGNGHNSGYASYPPQYPDSPYGPSGASPQGYGGHSSYSVQSPQDQQQPHGGYPFYQTPDGSWECRYCSAGHPQHRDQGSIWRSVNPPADEFIDQHLRHCRFYNQSVQTSMQPYPGTMFAGPPVPLNYPAYTAPPSPHQQSYWAHHGPLLHGWPISPAQASGYPSPGPPVAAPPQVYMSPHASQYPFPQGQEARVMAETMMSPPMPMSMAAPDDHAACQAIDYLTSSAQKQPPPRKSLRSPGQDEDELVLDEDKMLLTDYLYHVMKQLRVCRFAEADRKTRGGKRDNIAIGYGGLQCIHCVGAPNARKFYWSNVDRLANSFAEIPGHILKCRKCPPPIKQALQELKLRHPEQMARFPRGSQKVFFRRMWRRLHNKDPQPAGAALRQEQDAAQSRRPVKIATAPSAYVSTDSSPHQALSPSTSGEVSTFFVERSAEQAARLLKVSSSRAATSPPSQSSRVLLAIPEDKEWLSDMDCFVRRNVEVFPASDEDVKLNQRDLKNPIQQGQVGLRCIHCAIANGRQGVRGNAVSYPYSIGSIFASVREFQRLHLESCPHLPLQHKAKLEALKGSSSLTSVLRKYYVLAAKALGLYDTQDGVRSGAESVPLVSSVNFAFSPESESKVSKEMLEEESDKKLPPEAPTLTGTPGPEEECPSSAESIGSVEI